MTRGQARKSLWIETQIMKLAEIRRWGQARKSLWIETTTFTEHSFVSLVRLVRACGSKPFSSTIFIRSKPGQARKSLWIETFYFAIIQDGSSGQARKSLWIETGFDVCRRFNAEVGQARKSLWIETVCDRTALATLLRSGS